MALWILLVVFCFTGVFGRSLWGPNETREGSMIWDMYRHGQWLVPSLNGEPYLEKPPLLHWTGLLFCKLAGEPSEGLLRLPAALFGLGTLVLLMLLIRQGTRSTLGAATGEVAAWTAVLMCGTAAHFLEYSRIVLTDMALTFTVTLAIAAFWQAWTKPRAWRWGVFLVATALSFFAKAMIGPIFVWLAVGLFLLLRRRLLLAAGLGLLFVPTLLLVAGPWLLALADQLGPAAVRFMLWDNQFGRFFTFGNGNLPVDPFFVHKEPWHYYLHQVPRFMLPWSPLVIAACFASWRRWRRERGEFDLFLACWILGPLALLQVSSAKVATYALPLYPPLFAFAGVWLVTGRSWLARGLSRLSLSAAVLALSAVPAVMMSTSWLFPAWTRPGTLDLPGSVSAIAALVVLAGGVVWLVRLARRGEHLRGVVVGPAVVALAIVGVAGAAVPVVEAHRSYRPIAGVAGEAATKGVAIAIGATQSRDVGAFTFYLDRRLPVLDDLAAIVEYLRAPVPRGVIVTVKQLDELRTHLGATPVRTVKAGQRDSLSRSFVLVTNHGAEAAIAAIRVETNEGVD